MLTRLLLVSLFLLGSAANAASESVIGIFGDVHGHSANGKRVSEAMKALGVTHVIGMGDYNKFGEGIGRPPHPEDDDFTDDPAELARRRREYTAAALRETETILAMISGVAGVPKEKTFLLPGNFESLKARAETKMILEAMAKYGQVVSVSDREPATLNIGGKNIYVSHVALQTLPSALTPEGEFLLRRQKEAMAKEIRTPAGIDLRIYADTHMSGAYVETGTGTLVMNPGVLVGWKDPKEPYGFAVYRPAKNHVEFYTLGQTAPRITLDLGALDSPVCQSFLSKYK